MPSQMEVSPVTINGNTRYTGQDPPSSEFLSLDTRYTNYILIQTVGFLDDGQKAEVEQLGCQILEYVSERTYLCRFEPETAREVQDKPYIVFATPYHRDFVIEAGLKQNTGDEAPCTVHVLLHENPDHGLEQTKQELNAMTGLDTSEISVKGDKLMLALTPQQLEQAASLDSVKTINPVIETALYNNISRDILRADLSSVTAPANYRGKTQLIAVADTGFDLGNKEQPHPAFKGRVKELIAVGRKANNDASDPIGHGTHVCGSVLGNGFSESMGGSIQGTAPEAQLLVQSLSTEKQAGGERGFATEDLLGLFSSAYSHGARVHTNSWSPKWNLTQEKYRQNAYSADKFVWEHQDLVVCFAAGNNGVKAGGRPAVGDTSSAKNCITVGATESSRPSDNSKYNPNKLEPNNPTSIASFSSRGPTKEGRLKPDVMAPGTAILSTRSRHQEALDTQTFGVSKDSEWKFDSGTSMATPLVAGCAAVLKEYIISLGHLTPSAALIKAMLINGAVDLRGSHSGAIVAEAPNDLQGFGRVDLQGSMIEGGSQTSGFVDGIALKQSRISAPIIVPISHGVNGTGTLTATLAYTDMPGPLLQSDLSLVVVAGDGRKRYGNMGIREEFDNKNNVERVAWSSIPSGNAQIFVHCKRTTAILAQPYALVWNFKE